MSATKITTTKKLLCFFSLTFSENLTYLPDIYFPTSLQTYLYNIVEIRYNICFISNHHISQYQHLMPCTGVTLVLGIREPLKYGGDITNFNKQIFLLLVFLTAEQLHSRQFCHYSPSLRGKH